MAMLSTVGLAQTDSTYHEDQYGTEKSKDYGKSETTDQGMHHDRSFESDTTDQGMYQERSYESDTTDQGMYQNRSYESDTTGQQGQYEQGQYSNRSYESDTTDQGMYGNRSHESDSTYQGTRSGTASGELSEEAKEFIKTAAESSMLEMHLAQVALQKEEISEEITQYGQSLVEDHAEANRELNDIASSFQVDLPQVMDVQTDISDENQGLINDLMDMEGDEFHESFINRMVEEHQTLIDEFEQAKESIDNEELSRWIDNTLPSLKDHLSKAQDLQTKIENGELEDSQGLFDQR
jgi:putative membrane protein